MIMDGAEETDEKVEKSWLQFMYHEGLFNQIYVR
jgi:hypothetical protein